MVPFFSLKWGFSSKSTAKFRVPSFPGGHLVRPCRCQVGPRHIKVADLQLADREFLSLEAWSLHDPFKMGKMGPLNLGQ